APSIIIVSIAYLTPVCVDWRALFASRAAPDTGRARSRCERGALGVGVADLTSGAGGHPPAARRNVSPGEEPASCGKAEVKVSNLLDPYLYPGIRLYKRLRY